MSLDLFKGIAQIRAWGHNAGGGFEEAFRYKQLQAAHYVAGDRPATFCLIAYEQYLEFSLNGYILLTLADDQFEQGRAGFYVESAQMRVEKLQLKLFTHPETRSYPTNIPNF